MKTLKEFSIIFVIFLVVTSCNNDDDDSSNTMVTYKAVLNGASEVPTNASSATGTATLSFDTVTKIFSIVVTHNIASPTNGHIHKAAAGSNGSAVFPFSSFTSPINYTSSALDASQEADLNAGLYYVNIHTAAFPGGEIRGQLIKH